MFLFFLSLKVYFESSNCSNLSNVKFRCSNSFLDMRVLCFQNKTKKKRNRTTNRNNKRMNRAAEFSCFLYSCNRKLIDNTSSDIFTIFVYNVIPFFAIINNVFCFFPGNI